MNNTAKNKKLICEALGLTEMQYCEMVMHFGQMWMHRYFGHEEIMINALNKSKNFWAWWLNQWNNRDADFIRLTNLNLIEMPLNGMVKQKAVELYDETHEASELKIRPNRFVIQEVGKLIKQEENNLKKLQQNVNR